MCMYVGAFVALPRGWGMWINAFLYLRDFPRGEGKITIVFV